MNRDHVHVRIAAVMLAAIAMLPVVALPMAGCLNGKLTAGAESAIVGVFTLACPEEAAIPAVGPLVASACPGEEAALKAALDKVSAQPVSAAIASVSTSDAGQPIKGMTTNGASASASVPLLRMAPSGKLVHVGYAQADLAPAIQRALLTPATATAPSSSASAPAASSSAPSSSGAAAR